MKFSSNCLLVSFVSLLSTSSEASVPLAKKNESQLIKDVLANYDPLVWPNRNNTPNWAVRIGIHINSLVDMDEKEQLLSVSASFIINWQEPLLKWDPDEYETEVLYLPPQMLWKPDIIIQNAVENFGKIGNENLKIYVNHDGSVMWFPGDFYKLYCQVDVRHYPFDTQKCKIVLITWSCDKRPISLEAFDEHILNFVTSEENGEWKLFGVTYNRIWSSESKSYRLHFNLVLKRKTLFYIINMILPIVFLSLLNSLTFLLPANSGEKMTLCISVLLSYAIFLTLVNDALPENSDGVCFFSAYLATEVFLSAATTIVSVIVLTYHNKMTFKAGKVITWILPLSSKNKIKDEVSATKVMGIDQEVTSDVHDHVKFVRGIDIAQALDRLSFKFFTLLNVLVTILFFVLMIL